MNIDNAMLETRRYFVLVWGPDAFTIGTNRIDISAPLFDCTFKTRAAAQIVCDRLNLRAVLEAIREPSEAMATAGYDAFEDGYAAVRPRFKAMIDALIAEVGK